ncbi:MAG: SRPBCC domain-containing protein [Pseudomonadota bacterium]
MARSVENYQEQIHVTASAHDCFQAVATGMDKWWTKTTKGKLEKVGDRVTARFPPGFGFWTFEAVTLEEGCRIEMICVDAHHKVDGQPEAIEQEWLGTKIIWEFMDIGGKTEVLMTHDGLTPELNCWEICTDGWNHFFKHSLKAYLEGEDPNPHSAK